MKYLFLIILISFTIMSSARNSSDSLLKRNNIFLELGGNGLGYSLNYERIFNSTAKNKYFFRIGSALYKNPKLEFTVPVLIGIKKNISSSKHSIEFELGTNIHSFLFFVLLAICFFVKMILLLKMQY